MAMLGLLPRRRYNHETLKLSSATLEWRTARNSSHLTSQRAVQTKNRCLKFKTSYTIDLRHDWSVQDMTDMCMMCMNVHDVAWLGFDKRQLCIVLVSSWSSSKIRTWCISISLRSYGTAPEHIAQQPFRNNSNNNTHNNNYQFCEHVWSHVSSVCFKKWPANNWQVVFPNPEVWVCVNSCMSSYMLISQGKGKMKRSRNLCELFEHCKGLVTSDTLNGECKELWQSKIQKARRWEAWHVGGFGWQGIWD